MYITIAAAISVNAKITKDEGLSVRSWASTEDAQHLSRLIDEHSFVLMGSNTYHAMKPKLKPNKTYIVLTHHPEAFQQKKNNLWFINKSPGKIVKFLEKKRCVALLVLGGGMVNTSFLANGLIDELHLTTEPYIFAGGIDLFGTIPISQRLELMELVKLNDKGTTLARYRLQKVEPSKS